MTMSRRSWLNGSIAVQSVTRTACRMLENRRTDRRAARRAQALVPQYGPGLAFRATSRTDGGPRVRPMCPLLTSDALFAFIVPTKLTEVRRREGRGAMSSPRLRHGVCQMCGATLERTDRKICDACLPAYDLLRTKKLAATGKATLAAMRASADDPARTAEARAKIAEKSRERMRVIRGWEPEKRQEHGSCAI